MSKTKFYKKERSVRILAYHKINNIGNFELQIKYFLKNYNVLLPEEFKRHFLQNIQYPPNSLLITFDDGDNSIFHNVLPILKKYKIPAILFIVTELIDTSQAFWWDEIEYYLGKEVGQKKVWEVKTWPNSKRKTYLDNLRKDSEKPRLEYKQLNISQLKEMQEEGIMIANHSHTHPIFDQCTAEELDIELKSSIDILNSLGFSSKFFAYPNGNFSDLAESKLKEYGIEFAFLFNHKPNSNSINPIRISRLIVNDNTPIWKLKFILSGWHSKLLPLIKATAKFINR